MKLCSAGGLFILALCTFKRPVRKILGFKVPRTREPVNIALPRKMIGAFQDENMWNGTKSVMLMMTWLQAYSIYKLLKKHEALKYKVTLNTLIW